MTVRLPLVIVNGKVQQLQTGDTLAGASGDAVLLDQLVPQQFKDGALTGSGCIYLQNGFLGVLQGIDSTHTVADCDGVNYHHYVFEGGILMSYVKDTNP